MTESAIKLAVVKILRTVAPEANIEQLSRDENLREALDIDSFDFLNLMIGPNRDLGVEIPESDYGKLTTLAELVRYLFSRVGSSAGRVA
jgi:acyl carrier protein